jgi:hypothetical protein
MTALQARLFAGRAIRAAQAQEEFARRLRPAAEIPAQRSTQSPTVPTLIVLPGTTT